MSAANAAPRLPRPNPRAIAIGVVLASLAAFVIYAAQREMRKSVAAPQASAPEAHAFAAQRSAHSPAEERFAQALWNIHSEVRTAAVRMTFAGLAYKMGDSDIAGIKAKVEPLTEVFRQAETQLRGLDVPDSMQATRARYAGALQLYSDATLEMVKAAQGSKEAHLLAAQEMSERAAGVLLEVGEQLWPGEIKPN